MGLWKILLHLGNFALPALVVAALLSPGVLGRAGLTPLAAGWRRLWRTWAWLAAAGLVVLVAGLVGFGRDGKMATYAALVLVMGSLACWLQRPQAPLAGADRRAQGRNAA